MRDIMGMMKEMGNLKAKIEAMQAELETTLVDGRSGGGLVSVTLTAKGALKGVVIDPSLLVPSEKEVLEDLLIAAHAEARAKIEGVMADKMESLTGGLPLPPGLNLF